MAGASRLAALHGPVQRHRSGLFDAMGEARSPRTPAQLVNRLAPVARIYETWWRVRSLSLLTGRAFPLEEELAELRTAIVPRADQLVVDVACSEGLYGRHLAHHGCSVWFVDHSRAFLRRALHRSEQEGIGARVDAVRALAARLPFADGCADAVVMGASLNEIGDAQRAMAEMVRVLRPGGRLFCMSLVPATTRTGRLAQALARPSGIAFLTAGETVALLGDTMRLLEERQDGVVLRVTAEKRPE